MFGKIRDMARLVRAVNQYEELKQEIDSMDAKSIVKSKTFWLNLLGLAVTIGGILPVKFGVPVLAVANIGMRFLTNQPVDIFGSDDKK